MAEAWLEVELIEEEVVGVNSSRSVTTVMVRAALVSTMNGLGLGHATRCLA